MSRWKHWSFVFSSSCRLLSHHHSATLGYITTLEAMLKTCQTLRGTSRVLSWTTPSSGMSSSNLNVMIDCNFLKCFLHQSISSSLCSFEKERREWHRRTWYSAWCVLWSHCWKILETLEVGMYSRIECLKYVHVCWRMLTYAMLMFADIQRSRWI